MSGGPTSALSVCRIRLGQLFRFMGRFTHYGLVPFILYLGISLGQTDPGSPELSYRSIIWQ